VHPVRRHWQLILLGRKWSTFASHTELALHFFVMRTQIVVTNRSVGADTLGGVRPKIRRMKSWRDAEPHERSAPYAHAGFRNNRILARVNARLGPHDLARVGFGVREIIRGLEAFASLQHDHGKATRCQFLRHETSTSARTHDQHVCGVGPHGLNRATKPPPATSLISSVSLCFTDFCSTTTASGSSPRSRAVEAWKVPV